MKRIDVIYDGQFYSIGHRDLADVRSQVEAILASGEPGWLEVNYGDGRPQTAELLIMPGCHLSLIPEREPAEPE